MATLIIPLLLIQFGDIMAHYSYPRIANGSITYPGQFPFMASIQWSESPRLVKIPFLHFCGGTILNNLWILTAAHCIRKIKQYNNSKVKVGKYHTLKDDKHVQTVNIIKEIMHENYTGKMSPNDIALIKVEPPLMFNEKVKPANLPQPNMIEIGAARMIGWGIISHRKFGIIPDSLKKTTVSILHRKFCLRFFDRITPPLILEDTHLCINKPGRCSSACYGDSGGPVIQYTNGEPEVIGVISWSDRHCSKINVPTVITRVSRFINWISETMRVN